MLEKKYRNIVYFIGITIVTTIAIQFYWNLKIYNVNKQQLHNQVQVSFDKAIDNYYNNLAKSNVLTFIDSDSIIEANRTIATVKNKNTKNQLWIDGSIDSNHFKNIIKIRSDYSNTDTLEVRQFNISNAKHISVFGGEIDTLELKKLTTKIMFSFQEKLIDLKKVDSLFKVDLTHKNIYISYGLMFTYKNLISDITETIRFKSTPITDKTLNLFARSSFLPHESKLKLIYNASTITVLSTMVGSIVLSLLLSGFIIGCLLFLVKVIFTQKQLSEVKNDLISNITHEFKTPISTISLALEGLTNPDITKDEKKKKQYLSMSNDQLNKLNQMVEKLLETATLKTNQFELDKKEISLSELVKSSVEKYQFSSPDKSISLTVDSNLSFIIDALHFENAFNNIIDNAIKYGGNVIKIRAQSTKDNVELLIEDNGDGFENQYKQKIFDQFYRIPTGNIHNVKGFGIGLYYTKNIIEKHGGKIIVSENKKGKVIFKITLPNGS